MSFLCYWACSDSQHQSVHGQPNHTGLAGQQYAVCSMACLQWYSDTGMASLQWYSDTGMACLQWYSDTGMASLQCDVHALTAREEVQVSNTSIDPLNQIIKLDRLVIYWPTSQKSISFNLCSCGWHQYQCHIIHNWSSPIPRNLLGLGLDEDNLSAHCCRVTLSSASPHGHHVWHRPPSPCKEAGSK